MATNKDKKNLLERFDDITLNLIHSDPEAAKAFLKEEGFDIDEEIKNGEQQIKKLRFLSQASLNKEKEVKLLGTALIKLKQSIAENAEKASDVLRTLLQSKTPAIQYRKLEKWTDDEIRDVLHDVDLVKLLEELDHNSNPNV